MKCEGKASAFGRAAGRGSKKAPVFKNVGVDIFPVVKTKICISNLQNPPRAETQPIKLHNKKTASQGLNCNPGDVF